MSDDPNIWSLIGINVRDLIAGTAGGTAAALAFKRAGAGAAVASVVVGALTASYMTAWMVKYIGDFAGGAAFVVGLCSMAICQSLMSVVSKYLPNGQNNVPPAGNG